MPRVLKMFQCMPHRSSEPIGFTRRFIGHGYDAFEVRLGHTSKYMHVKLVMSSTKFELHTRIVRHFTDLRHHLIRVVNFDIDV